MKKYPPEIIIHRNRKTKIGPYFKHSVGGLHIMEKTIVELSFEKAYLKIQFTCMDDPFVNNNYYSENNSELWNQEVFEVFICKGQDDPIRYLEIEINPNNAIFIAKIHNPDMLGSSLHSDIVDPLESGIEHAVNKESDSWDGYLKIPFSLINGQDSEDIKQFRINFFRVILKKKQNNINWKCSTENSIFACWSSTMANEPEFHRSKHFGLLTIKE